MAKQLTFGDEAREALRSGLVQLAKAVKVTLGPRGRNAVLDKSYGSPNITKDGVTVAEEIELKDKLENLAVQMVKSVASKTSDAAGDGTTTATVLAEAIYLEGLKNVTAGANPMALKRGIDKAVEQLIKEVEKMSRPIKDKKDVARVAAVAANNVREIGDIIANAMEKVGKDGVITVEEGKALETEIEVVEGMQFDRGFISPNFITNQENMTVEMDNPYILICEKKISAIKDIVPLLETITKANQPLFIIAEDVESEALATMVVNKLRGTLQCCAVKAPGYGDRRKALLEDIAVLTGGVAVVEDLGIDLEKITTRELGRAKHVRIDKDNTTIVEGAGKEDAIQGRIGAIRRELDETTSEYDREKLQERLAKLAGGVAQINVGAATESEMKEKKARVEDALHATRAAVESGIVPGGGVALIRAAESLSKLKLEGDEKIGAEAVARAITFPLRGIVANAGGEAPVILDKIRKGKGDFGYNADTDAFENFFETGIIDPAKVTISALRFASSVAGLMLTTECIITEAPEKEEDTK